MKFSFSAYLLFFSVQTCLAQTLDVKQVFEQSLRFIVQNQCDSTIEGKQYAGEWPIYMQLTEPFLFIGRKQKARDSNCFNVAAVHNFISEIYLRDTSLLFLKPVLKKAYSEIKTYETPEGKYNFWKLLPPKYRLRPFAKNTAQFIHRATNYNYKARLVCKMGNVTEDADDTSLGNLAKHYQNIIFGDSLALISNKAFDNFLDKDRKNRNWYNLILPSPKNSGAYLTWLYPEYKFENYSPLASYLSLVFVFLPWSSAYPVAYQPTIPFGANDVCVVVNANILNYLASTKQVNKSLGKNGAVEIIENSIQKKQWLMAGIYYPNRYHIDYSVAKAYHSGVEELHDATLEIFEHIISTQNPDGSFASSYYVNKGDAVQSTAYALHALLDLRDKGLSVPSEALQKAFHFLFSKAILENDTCHWDGGVYFSGGTILRTSLFWQSDAYTTALIAHSIQRYYLGEDFRKRDVRFKILNNNSNN